MIQNSSVNALNAINDYLKIEYPEGMRNEFNTMEALVNFLQKDTLTGKYKEKLFGLGIVDNMRALGDMWDKTTFASKSTDKYNIDLDELSLNTGAENVTARFDVTKFLNTFSVTDEALLIGTTDGSLYDTVRDNLARMNQGLKHTQARMTYGGKDGIVGIVTHKVGASKVNGRQIIQIKAANSNSLVPGMQVAVHSSATKYFQGKIWQKVADLDGEATLYIIADDIGTGLVTSEEYDATKFVPVASSGDVYHVYSRQRDISTGIVREYQGLNDILIAPPNTLFGVNLTEYPSLKSTVKDLEDSLVTEQLLDKMSDHVLQHNSDDTNIDMVVSSYEIISAIKQQFYGFKQYDMDSTSKDFNMGRKDVVYDNYRFHKDKYSRDKNVYMLDTQQMGELLRKDFGWLTEGRESILERRDGTEIYEAIMTKYADFYINAWRAHAAFTNAASEVTAE